LKREVDHFPAGIVVFVLSLAVVAQLPQPFISHDDTARCFVQNLVAHLNGIVELLKGIDVEKRPSAMPL
jgi:hypothetical protein